MRLSPRLRLIPFLLLAACPALFAQGPVPALTDAQAREARRLMDEIRGNPRGPYGQIRWYCDDGRVLPPQGTPCRPGRGYQHAEPSASARKLELLNIDIAHFLSGMSFEEFLDAPRNYYWLRQMVLIDYLVNRLDGWIYRRAWQRRGVRQGEDEEREARRLLAETSPEGDEQRQETFAHADPLL